MPPNRKRHAVDSAANERWALLGRLLRARRTELGYAFRPAFAEARLPKTQDGNTMIRMVVTVENNERPGTYAPGRLEQFARAYAVTEESVHAVLNGEADQLTPAALQAPAAALPLPAAPPAPARQPLPDAPMDDAARTAADRPYADRLWADLRAWAAKGVTDPSGAQLFGAGTPDAQAWDGTAGRMDDGDRVWHIADLQRRDDGRRTNGRSAAGA